MTAERVSGRAFARAGLLGNPSDGYEGRAIATTLRDFHAEVTLEPAEHFAIVSGEADRSQFADVREAVHELRLLGPYGGERLLRATLTRFAAHHPGLAELDRADARLRFRMSYRTTMPRQVGLSGTSAIVIAGLRALASWFGREIDPFELSELALSAEVDDLGIAAGPMDRVIQAYEGVMAMDLASPRRPSAYRRLDPACLPPLFLAWDPEPGTESGRLHSDVRERFQRGDAEVHQAMRHLRDLVDRGLACLEAGEILGFAKLVDENFDTRAAIFPMRQRDRELVHIGRGAGAAVKFAGSGGAVIGVLLDPSDFDAVADAYRQAGFRALAPRIP